MSRKGQTCQMCDGNCCEGHIAYRYVTIPTDKYEALMDGWPMGFTVKEIQSLGGYEVYDDQIAKPCQHFQRPGCALHGPNKPNLCRGYWCYGKHWKPKVTESGGED